MIFRLGFLPINQAWCFLFGSDTLTAEIVPMGADRTRFFSSRGDACAAAREAGLDVDAKGNVRHASELSTIDTEGL